MVYLMRFLLVSGLALVGLVGWWLWRAYVRACDRVTALEAQLESRPKPQGWSVGVTPRRLWITPMGTYSYDEVITGICGPVTAGEE